MKNKWTIEIISALLLILFLYAGLIKLTRYQVFVFQVSESPFGLLAKSAHWIAWLIPVAELTVASLLPFSKTRLSALYASVAMMAIFTIYVGGLLLSGLPLPCACGGIIEALHWTGHLVLNILFLSISIIGVWIETKIKLKTTNRPSYSYSV
jgi:hypothetical protein